jgi:hypothetical protein
MKKRFLFVVFIAFAAMVGMTGCDKIKGMLGLGGTQPVQVGPGGVIPGTQPTGPGGAPVPGVGFQTLTSCEIKNFKAGILHFDDKQEFTDITETTTVPYVPGTYMGIYFEYTSKTGKPINYREEEFFPSPPQNWSLWEGSEGSYRTFPEENRAEYKTVLPPEKTSSSFLSHWGFNPSGDPIGQWRWDIYFNEEYYTTVIFNVTPSTY